MPTRNFSTKDLRLELERQGRVPAPPPRRQFVEELLTRIQVGGEEPDVVLPEPVPLADRRTAGRLRVMGALAVAAALLAVVGVLSQIQGSDDGSLVVMPAGSEQEQVEVDVKPDGTIDRPDGLHSASCQDQASFEVNGETFRCSKGDDVVLEVRGGKVIRAELAPVPVIDVETAQPGPTAGGATAAPVTPVPGPGPSGSPPAGSATPPPPGAVTPPPVASPTAPTTVPPVTSAPPPPTPPTTRPPVSFKLEHTVGSGTVTLTWPASANPSFHRYVVLRTVSRDPNRQPDTPTTDGSAPVDQAATLTRPGDTTFTQALDGSGGVPYDTVYVAYRVAVLGADSTPLAISETLVLQLRWTFRPSEDNGPRSTSTTVPAATVGGAAAEPARAKGEPGDPPKGRP